MNDPHRLKSVQTCVRKHAKAGQGKRQRENNQNIVFGNLTTSYLHSETQPITTTNDDNT